MQKQTILFPLDARPRFENITYEQFKNKLAAAGYLVDADFSPVPDSPMGESQPSQPTAKTRQESLETKQAVPSYNKVSSKNVCAGSKSLTAIVPISGIHTHRESLGWTKQPEPEPRKGVMQPDEFLKAVEIVLGTTQLPLF